MYEGIDEDLASNYDPKKLASKQRTPKFPIVDNGSFECLLKRVTKEKTTRGKKLYEFRIQVTKSNSELVLEGAQYVLAYFPGSDNVDNEIFWRNVSYPLMAVNGHTDIGTFNAPEKLGELITLSKGDEDLDIPFRMQTKLEKAQPNKDGVYPPKQLQDDGKTPKIYRRDTFIQAVAAK